MFRRVVVMRGSIVLSHGLESGPDATKVTALAAVARARGWRELRPDYRDLDARADPQRIEQRTARLLEHVPRDGSRVIFAGSSMGAFCSALASLEVRPQALFLLSPPLEIPGYPVRLDAAQVPTVVVHGWDDELIPAHGVIAWAAQRRATLHVVPDGHRLSGHVDIVARWFDDFLARQSE